MYIYIDRGLMRQFAEPTLAQWVNHLTLTWAREGARVWDKPAKGPEKTRRKSLNGRKPLGKATGQ